MKAKCAVTQDLNRYQKQVDEQALFDIECEKVGAQMLVDLELNGEFSVHQKDDTSKVICYQDLLVEFAESNPDLFCDALRSDKEQFEKAALQLAAKWRDFVIEQIDEHYAIEHVQNHGHNLRGH